MDPSGEIVDEVLWWLHSFWVWVLDNTIWIWCAWESCTPDHNPTAEIDQAIEWAVKIKAVKEIYKGVKNLKKNLQKNMVEKLPELAGKTLDEIENLLKKKKFTGQKTYKDNKVFNHKDGSRVRIDLEHKKWESVDPHIHKEFKVDNKTTTKYNDKWESLKDWEDSHIYNKKLKKPKK